MDYRKLGILETKVSELSFGALPMGPLQKNLPVEVCTELLVKALQGGINFIDTAQVYGTYEPIGRAILETGIRPVIASKSKEKTYEKMEEAIREALEMMGVNYLDIFHLHAARASADVFTEMAGALQCLKEYKANGKIKAIGISAHSVEAVKKAATVKEIDIVFPILNQIGMGILEGNVQEMEGAIGQCHQAGKGLYLMKVLAGGNLIDQYQQAMTYARSIPGIASIALGMVSPQEIDYNLAYFNGELKVDDLPSFEKYHKQVKIVSKLCKVCGTCIETCPNEAIDNSGSKPVIVEEKCLTCGYCVGECPEFAIRVY